MAGANRIAQRLGHAERGALAIARARVASAAAVVASAAAVVANTAAVVASAALRSATRATSMPDRLAFHSAEHSAVTVLWLSTAAFFTPADGGREQAT
jgi:hypothetical protein